MNNNTMTLEDLAERILQADTVTVTRTLTYSFDPSVDDKYDIEETPTFLITSVQCMVETLKFLLHRTGMSGTQLRLHQTEDGEHWQLTAGGNYHDVITHLIQEMDQEVFVDWLNSCQPDVQF